MSKQSSKNDAQTAIQLASLEEKGLATFAASGEDAQEMLAQGGVLAESHLSLEEGDSVRGIFIGLSTMEMTDQASGEIRNVPTVRIEATNGKARARLIGSYVLVEKLRNVPEGTEVFIARGATRKMEGKGGKQVTDYHVIIGTNRRPTKAVPALPSVA